MNTDSTSQTQNTAGSAGQLQSGANNPFAVGAVPTISTTGFGTSSQTSTPLPQVSQTQNASQISDHLSSDQSSPTLSTAPDAATLATNAQAANASVSIPTAPQVDPNAPPDTAAQTQQKGLLARVAALVGGQASLATDQTQAENQAGLPGMAKNIQDLTNQLQGLNDAGGQYGSIQNTERLAEAGGNVEAAMHGRPAVTQQIIQNSIMALQVKGQLLAAQGSYGLALSAADKAGQLIFDAATQQINGAKAQLDALAPQLTKDEAAQAAATKAALDQKTQQIQWAHQDYIAGQGLINTALANAPTDPQAKLAIQKANQLDPQSPTYLKDVAALVGNYQKDPIAVQQQLATLDATRADTRYKNAQTNALNPAPGSPGDPNAAPADPNSQSILSQTGLSIAAFNYLTQGTSALSRMTSAARQQVMAEAQKFLNKNGIDYSTFQSQYTAQNKVVQDNVARAAQTKVFAGEVSGSVDSLISAIQANKDDQKNGALISSITGGQGGGMSSLKAANVLSLMQGKAVNNAFAQTYSTQLAFVANDLAGYLAAARGKSQPEIPDQEEAARIIANGMNTGSLTAFKKAVDSNEEKVNGVVNGAVTSAQKSVWDQFGVGDKYNPTASTAASNTTTKSGKPFDVAGAKKAGYSDADIQAYLASH